MATTTVEIDSDLLVKLRKRSPGKSDRELLEELAAVTLGFETIHRVQRLTAEAGVDQEEIEGEAVRVVREHRRRFAAGRARELKCVVVDPNILLSALVGNPEAAPAILLEAIHDHTVEMVACPTLIAEVRDNLTEPYFRALLDQGEAEQAVSAIALTAVMFGDPVDPEPVLRDRSDDYLLALARSAKAEAIITGDKDLLDHPGLQPPAIGCARGHRQARLPPPE